MTRSRSIDLVFGIPVSSLQLSESNLIDRTGGRSPFGQGRYEGPEGEKARRPVSVMIALCS